MDIKSAKTNRLQIENLNW